MRLNRQRVRLHALPPGRPSLPEPRPHQHRTSALILPALESLPLMRNVLNRSHEGVPPRIERTPRCRAGTRHLLQRLLLLTLAWFATSTFGGWTNHWSTNYGGKRPGEAFDTAEAATMGSGGHVFVGGRSRSTAGSGTTETLVVKLDPVSGKPIWEFRSSSVGIENATVSRIEVVDGAEVLVALGGHSSSRKDFALLRLGEASGDVRFVVPSYRSLLGWQTIDGWSKRAGSLFVAGNSGGPGRSEVSVAEIRLADGQVSWISTLTISELEGATVEQIALDLSASDKLGLLMEVMDFTTHATTAVVSLVDTAERSNLWVKVMPKEETFGIGGLAVGKTGDVAFWTTHPGTAGERFSRLTCLSGAGGAELWQSAIPESKSPIAIARDSEDNVVLLNHLIRSHSQSVEKINGRTGVLSWDSMVTVHLDDFSSSAATDLVVDRAGDIGVALPPPHSGEDSSVVKLSGVDGSVLWIAGDRASLGYRFGTLQENGVLLVVGVAFGDFAVEALKWTSGGNAWGIRYGGMIYGWDVFQDACVNPSGGISIVGEIRPYTSGDKFRFVVCNLSEEGNLRWVKEFEPQRPGASRIGYRVQGGDNGDLYITGGRSDEQPDGFMLKLREDSGEVVWETKFAAGGSFRDHYCIQWLSRQGGVVVATKSPYPSLGYSVRLLDDESGALLWEKQTPMGAGESRELVEFEIEEQGDCVFLSNYSRDRGDSGAVLERRSAVTGDLVWERFLSAAELGKPGYGGLTASDLSLRPSGVIGLCGSITNATTGLPEAFYAIASHADGEVKWHTIVGKASASGESALWMTFSTEGDLISSIKFDGSDFDAGLSLVKLFGSDGSMAWRRNGLVGGVYYKGFGFGEVLPTNRGTYMCSGGLFEGGQNSGFVLTEVYDDDGSEAWSEAFDVSRIVGGLKMLSLGDSQFCVVGDSVRGRRDLFAMGLGSVDELRVRVRRKSTGVELRVAGLGAARGSVERSEDLIAWTQLGDIASNEVFFDPHPPVRQSFYRVVKLGGDGATRD